MVYRLLTKNETGVVAVVPFEEISRSEKRETKRSLGEEIFLLLGKDATESDDVTFGAKLLLLQYILYFLSTPSCGIRTHSIPLLAGSIDCSICGLSLGPSIHCTAATMDSSRCHRHCLGAHLCLAAHSLCQVHVYASYNGNHGHVLSNDEVSYWKIICILV